MPNEIIFQLKTQNIAILIEGEKVSYPISENPKWVEIGTLDSLVWDAFILNEDNKFWEHNGLNYKQMRVAITDYLFKGKKLRGASTITQQVAKNMFLDPSRSWKRKLKEAIIAKELERQLSKVRILEIYLNIAEFEKGIYGLYNASEYYFGKQAIDLSITEAIYLASILPNPSMNNDAFDRGKLTSRDILEMNWTLQKMLKKQKLDSAQFLKLLDQPILFRKDVVTTVE